MSVGNYGLRTGHTFSGKPPTVRVSDSVGSPVVVATHLCPRSERTQRLCERPLLLYFRKFYLWKLAVDTSLLAPPSIGRILVFLMNTNFSFWVFRKALYFSRKGPRHWSHVHSLRTWAPPKPVGLASSLLYSGPFCMGQGTLFPVIPLLWELVRATFSWKRNLGAFHLEFVSVIFIFLVSCSLKS